VRRPTTGGLRWEALGAELVGDDPCLQAACPSGSSDAVR
jgi:hypothetical protein